MIKDAALAVSDALNNLLNQIGNGGRQPNDQYDDILNASDKLFNSIGNADEMVRQAKILAQVHIDRIFEFPGFFFLVLEFKKLVLLSLYKLKHTIRNIGDVATVIP